MGLMACLGIHIVHVLDTSIENDEVKLIKSGVTLAKLANAFKGPRVKLPD